jgi:hypothetical protein
MTSRRSGLAPRATARRARSALQALIHAAFRKVRPAMLAAMALRSATKTSEPCRLTTSGREPRASAAIAPPGMTQ